MSSLSVSLPPHYQDLSFPWGIPGSLFVFFFYINNVFFFSFFVFMGGGGSLSISIPT